MEPNRLKSFRVSERLIGRFVLVSAALGFLALVVAVGALIWAMVRAQEHRALVQHTNEVARALGEFETLTERLESGRRGYLLSGEARRLEVALDAEARLPELTRRIETLVADNIEQLRRARTLESLSRRQRSSVRETIARAQGGDFIGAIAEYREFDARDPVYATRATARRMAAVEERLLAERDRRQDATVARSYTLVAIAGALLLIVAAATMIVLRRYTRDLTDSRDALAALNENLEGAVRERTADLQRAEADLRESNARLEALLKEVNHRVANSLQIVTAMVHLQSQTLPSGEARAALEDTRRRIDAIGKVHRSLYASGDADSVDMAEYLAALVAELKDTWSTPEAARDLRLSSDPIRLPTDKAVSLGVIVNELVSNACKYAYPPDAPGEIRIALKRDGADHFLLRVEDDGRGLPEGGVSAARGTGLGAKLIDAMARSLQSSLVFDPHRAGVSATLRAACA